MTDESRLPVRFWDRITITGKGCWEWTGTKVGEGKYGQMMLHGKKQPTHRLTYETYVGPIPPGLQIDHLCRNHACCNPNHLEAVTPQTNVRRGTLPDVTRARHAAITQCPRGHGYTPENVIRNSRGSRRCRTCHNELVRQRRRLGKA